MSTSASPDQHAALPMRVGDFYLARQPILNRAQELCAYELLFRNAPGGPARISTDLSATASVIAHVAQLGLEQVIGDRFAFIKVDAAVLSSDIFEFLPRERVVLDADHGELERAIKRDVSLALNLLRLLNSAAVGAGRRIDSLGQAIAVLGRSQLQRWLQIMLYAKPLKGGHGGNALLMLATTREGTAFAR